MVNLVDEAVANVIGRKRAYGYIRTSSDAQDTASSAARQKHNIEKRSVELNFYVEEYFQEVASGLNVEDRATFLLMIEKALKRENNVSAIFCDDLSRFTRSDKDPYKYVDMLLEKDIVLITVKEGSSDNIRDRRAWKHQYSTNSDYIEDLSLWTMDGLATSVRAGHFPFQPPYGYIRYYFVEKVKEDHRSERRRRGSEEQKTLNRPEIEPDPETAIYVIEAYNRRYAGERVMEIVNDFNRRGIPSPSGGPWTAPTLRFILKNIVYIGTTTLVLQRRVYGGITTGGLRAARRFS